jgi:tetratricopeptide (TPR) repeat protein
MFAFFRSKSKLTQKSNGSIKRRETGGSETQNRQQTCKPILKDPSFRNQQSNPRQKSESAVVSEDSQVRKDLKRSNQMKIESVVNEGRETSKKTTLKIPTHLPKNKKNETTNVSQKPFLKIPIKNFSSSTKDEVTVSLNSMGTADLSIQAQESRLSHSLDKGRMHMKKKDFKKAKELLVVALDIQIDLNGRENRDTVKLFKELATICQQLGEYDEAKFYFEHSVIFSESISVFGSIGGSTRASSIGSADGKTTSSVMSEAPVATDNVSKDDPAVKGVKASKADPAVKGVKAAAKTDPAVKEVKGLDAITKHMKTLEICDSHYGKDSLMSAVIYTVIASCYKNSSEVNKAFDYYEKALNIREAKSPNSIETGECYYELGLILHQLDEYTESLAYLHNAAQIFEANKKVYRTKKVMRDIRRVCRHLVQKNHEDSKNV